MITNAKVPCDMSEETCTMVQRGLEQGGIALEFIGIGWEEDDEQLFATPMQRTCVTHKPHTHRVCTT